MQQGQPMMLRRLRALLLPVLLCSTSLAQLGVPSPAPAPKQPEAPADALGRTTPRGTVLGFLNAARKSDDKTAVLFLNTRLNAKAATELAHQLYAVLDRRLPARLELVSDRPEGSLSSPAEPDRDVVGTIGSSQGDVEIVVERVRRGNAAPIWLFSKRTLDSIPALYDEVDAVAIENFLPAFLLDTKIASIPLYEWLAVLVALPLVYSLTVLLNRFFSALVGRLGRRLRGKAGFRDLEVLPPPARLLILAGTIRWALSAFSLPLLARRFWASTASVITIVAAVWLLILLNSWAEAHIRGRFPRGNLTAAFTRLARRAADVLVVFGGVLVGLKYFGVNVSAALAGLGVGGIAVALAAQKTLENVVGGVSLVFDQALHVGDTLKWGDTVGTVEDIGLRSTRIRTLDRTVLSIPNGQMSTMSLEIISARDKFWFNPILKLQYSTSPFQMHSILEGVRSLLAKDGRVEQSCSRVRFLRFGASSLEVEVFAYLWARDWVNFLEIQEGLLFKIMETIHAAGTTLALPSQTTYLAGSVEWGGDLYKRNFETRRNEDAEATRNVALSNAPG